MGFEYTIHTTPTAVAGPGPWRDLADHCFGHCAVRNDATLWCWGRMDLFPIFGIDTIVTPPKQVGTDNDWAHIAAAPYRPVTGAHAACGIRTDGALDCWRLTADNTMTLERIGEANDAWTEIAVGQGTVCAIRDDESLWCWGQNDHGQLGDGTVAADSAQHPMNQVSGQWRHVSTQGPTVCGILISGIFDI